MRYSFFHWGLHPWAIYSLLALALAFFNFRKGTPGLISYTFYPLLKEKVKGPYHSRLCNSHRRCHFPGNGSDPQISGGLSFVTPVENNFMTQLIIIIAVTFLFILSATTGLNKGIKFLSNLNILLAVLLMLFVLFTGPTKFIMNLFTTTRGSYIQELPQMSFYLGPFNRPGKQLDSGLDNFLLGLVDRLGAICGNVYCPRFQRENCAGIRDRCIAGADSFWCILVLY